MSQILDQEPEFWLPAEFLTDEDILMENKQNPNHYRFQPAFPFDFTGVNSGDVEDQLAELTSQLGLHKSDKITKPLYYLSGSPQSTLFQFGSPIGTSQVSSPTSKFAAAGDSMDLIYQAAAQVAKMKRNGVDAFLESRRNMVSQNGHSQQAMNNSSAFYNSFVQRVREELILKHHQQQQEQQRRNVWSNNQSKDGVIFPQQQQNGFSGLNAGAYLENDQTTWPCLQYMMQKNLQKRSGNRAAYSDGGSGNRYFSSAKKPSAGTGVFLPRCYGSNINDNDFGRTNKKTGCSTKSLDGIGERNNPHVNGGRPTQTQWQSRRGGGFCSDYEVQLAHKNAMLMHQRSSHLQQVALGHELGLPQEWTY